MTNEFGWYRYCNECSQFIKKKNKCKMKKLNKDNNCKEFKRVWWLFWVPK
jgi:hypothetical protein